MNWMRRALQVAGIYTILVGLIALIPSLAARIFAYEVRDFGVLLMFAGASLAFGIVAWGLAQGFPQHENAYRPLAPYLAAAFAIGVVMLVWGWTTKLYTTRTVIVPLIIDIVLTWWFWRNRPKA